MKNPGVMNLVGGHSELLIASNNHVTGTKD